MPLKSKLEILGVWSTPSRSTLTRCGSTSFASSMGQIDLFINYSYPYLIRLRKKYLKKNLRKKMYI